jgi:hypothetical protein
MNGIRRTVGVGLTAILVSALGPALGVAQLRDWDGEWLPPITTNCTTVLNVKGDDIEFRYCGSRRWTLRITDDGIIARPVGDSERAIRLEMTGPNQITGTYYFGETPYTSFVLHKVRQ